MKKVIKYSVIAICSILCIKFLIWLFTDQPYPGSPYDTWYVLEEPIYIEKTVKKDLADIEEVIKEYAKEWTGSEKLREVGFYTNKEHEIKSYLFTYVADDIEEYPGRLYIYCRYIDECLVITYAHTLYGKDFNPEVKQLSDLEEVETIYYRTLEYLEDNKWDKEYSFEIYIKAQSIYIQILDKEGKFVKNLKLDIIGDMLIEDN